MEITILGCSAGYPAPGGATSGYLVRSNDKNLLIDCGSGVLSKLFRLTLVENIDAIILSHLHDDHISDMSVLKYAIQMNRKNGMNLPPIPVYAPESPENKAASIWDEPSFAYQKIDGNSHLSMFGLEITFVRTEHPLECYGIRLQKGSKVFSYTADAVYTSDLEGLCRDADLAIMDCGCLEKDRNPGMLHMAPADCYRLFTKSHPKRVVLSHLVPYYGISEVLEEANSCPQWPYEIAACGNTYVI